jgi:hypothetical protein
MPIPSSLSRKLRETLGDDAGGDLVTWLEEERAERLHLRAELADFHKQMGAMEMRLTAQTAAMEMRLAAQIADVKSDLMKWSFVFWCGAVTAVAALAGVLRP